MAASRPAGLVERLLDGAARLAGPAALGVTLLLALQWPLRDLVGRGALLANDSAQALFALYVAVAVAHAQRRGSHVRTRTLAGPPPRWHRVAGALLVLPWSVFLIVTAWPHAWRSWLLLERFPDTADPGYFLIKTALLLVPALVAAQALRDLAEA